MRTQELTVANRFDVFPATVVHPLHGTLTRTRAFVSDGRLRVYGENGRNVELLFETSISDVTRAGRSYSFASDDGPIEVTRQGSCGCGSPLKKMPWPS